MNSFDVLLLYRMLIKRHEHIHKLRNGGDNTPSHKLDRSADWVGVCNTFTFEYGILLSIMAVSDGSYGISMGIASHTHRVKFWGFRALMATLCNTASEHARKSALDDAIPSMTKNAVGFQGFRAKFWGFGRSWPLCATQLRSEHSQDVLTCPHAIKKLCCG